MFQSNQKKELNDLVNCFIEKQLWTRINTSLHLMANIISF